MLRLSVPFLPYLLLSTSTPLMVAELVAHAEEEVQVPTLRCKDAASACLFQAQRINHIPRLELEADVAVEGPQGKRLQVQVEIVVKHNPAASAAVRTLRLM